ncbi:hypothetical protein MB46_17755 [Arthrobacter alpinus]|uniref:DUF6264 family protein n=1 Tax=Arthrobacter alpinus TaxID=656366 RepID=UPI00073AE310|nr:DUF6264 family protein [Arthrobacter alpinus]ALV47056.1 hypothetical protein MB46_17755 [Arthrobacter alpinus]
MTTSGEEPQEQPTTLPGSYGEIAPGVPRYGQYAPAGWEPPQEIKDAQEAATSAQALPPAPTYPGFGGSQPGMPSQPGQPGQANGFGTHLAPPSRVLMATRMILAAGVMQAISVVALLAVMLVPSVKSSVIDALQSALGSTPELAEVYADPTLVNVALFFAFIFSIAMTLTYFWLARKIRKGATWARTTGLVLAILSLVFLSQPNPLTIVQVCLGAIGVILLFGSPAKEFFAAQKANRATNKS